LPSATNMTRRRARSCCSCCGPTGVADKFGRDLSLSSGRPALLRQFRRLELRRER
jgi:hypothetical protein